MLTVRQTKFYAINKDFWEKRKSHYAQGNERAVDAI